MTETIEYNYGMALSARQEHDYEKALYFYQKVLREQPNNILAWNGMGTTLKFLEEFDKAIRCYSRALEIAPNFETAEWNIRILLLLLGNYSEGALKYHWLEPGNALSGVAKTREPHPKPVWNGKPFEGTLLLYSQHGLGDVINFIRYAGIAKLSCNKVIVETHQELKDLIKTCPYVDEVYAIGEELPEFDQQMEIVYLPFLFPANKPSCPYLFPKDTDLSKIVQLYSKDNLKVGIVWAGNPSHTNDKIRSCDQNLFTPLLKYAKFFSLQKNNKLTLNIAQFGTLFDTMADTASVIKYLDLVISVDTSVAHLAGAMGKPTWLLLPHVPDWRWGCKGDNEWYSSVKLFRQKSPLNWFSVFKNIEINLVSIIEDKRLLDQNLQCSYNPLWQ